MITREFRVIENGVEKMSFCVLNRELVFSFPVYNDDGKILDKFEMSQHIDHIRDVCTHKFSVDSIAETFMGAYRFRHSQYSHNDIFDDLNVFNFIKSAVSCVMFPENIGFDSMKKDLDFFGNSHRQSQTSN